MTLTPWKVEFESDMNYQKIIQECESENIEIDLIERFEVLTGHKAHMWIKRGQIFSHRDFNKILDLYEKKEPFYLYTGRVPSSKNLHFGHLIPFMFTKWLQDVFDVPAVIQITDDEKYLWKEIKDEESYNRDNIKDIISIGFDMEKTFIFSNIDYFGKMYSTVLSIQKTTTLEQVEELFGFKNSDSIGKISFPAIQAAPSFSSSFPIVLDNKNITCLVICAIDQDPYFKLARDLSTKLETLQPCVLHCKFLPSLQGIKQKMSSTNIASFISLTDSFSILGCKIKKSFSGGAASLKEHRLYGANIDIDIPFQYLAFFLDDDEILNHIREEYSKGRATSSEIKSRAIELFFNLIENFTKIRENITDDVIDFFMSERAII